MDFPRIHTLKEICDIIDCKYIGNDNFTVKGVNEIHVVEEGDIVFVDHPKYYDKALQSKATTILINKVVDCPKGKSLIISEDPFRDFNKIINHFRPFKSCNTTISSSSRVANNTIIQPNCFIGNNVIIGENCIIHSNVSIYDNTVIGDNVVINSNCVIGGEAFYYKNRPNQFDQLLSGGNVIIQDNVHIGAGSTIDRGVTSSTIIGEGSKLDNLIQIGHDTIIGTKCLIASQVGIAGCVVIGNEVTIWGQVGITSGVFVGDKAVISAKSGVSKSLEGNKSYFGIPAEDFRSKYKEIASIKKIPEILNHLKL